MKNITKIKIKYYSKEVLKYLLLAGAVYVAASSPRFALGITKNISRTKPSKQKVTNTFKYLKRRGLVEIRRDDHDVRIMLTSKGKKMAGKYQIDDLKIEKPKKWDKKWRLVVFDIPNASRMLRDIFRRRLKEFGFFRLQQSVWAHQYSCEDEVKMLRDFLGLNKRQIQIVEATLKEDAFLRKIFKL